MANKKINQLVLKTTIQSTDLFPLGDATTGQLYKKTIAELQAAIGGAVISVNGLVGTVVLDTDDIQELTSPTNKYFTDARARAAISLTTTGNSGASTYSSSTGVLNVPTYTLAGLGGITAGFLSGGTGITYNSSTGVISYSGTVFTDSSIRALVSAGTGLSYNSSTGVFSYSGTVYTDASIRALISLTTSGSSGASTYNNTTGVLNVPTYTLAGLGGISLTSLSGSAPITYNSSTGAIGITQATGSTNGYLSSSDWTTFNSKQSALTLGNVTESVSNVLMFPDGGTNKTIGNLSIQVVQSGSTTNGYLSTTDWNTFNNKQNAITLTTTGTSGAATFSSGTLNIPQYQSVLTNPVTGTGTTNYVTKWTSSSAIGNSAIQEISGNVGIGVTPSSWGSAVKALQIGTTSALVGVNGATNLGENYFFNGTNAIYLTTANATLYQQTSGQHSWFTAPSGTAGNAITFTERMRIGSDGTKYFGTYNSSRMQIDAPGEYLRSYTNNYYIYSLFNDSNSLSIESAFAGNIIFRTANQGTSSSPGTATERMRITSGGNIGVGTTSPTAIGTGYTTIDIEGSSGGGLRFGNGTPQAFMYAASGALDFGTNTNSIVRLYTNDTLRIFITSGGNILMGTSTDNGERLYVSGSIRATGSITANSDARLKKNIERIENALEKVGQISGYTYNTIYDEDRHAGVIAQEIDKVLPEIVNKGNDGLMGVEYGNISALLIEAIKDLKQRNEKLEAIVEGLSK